MEISWTAAAMTAHRRRRLLPASGPSETMLFRKTQASTVGAATTVIGNQLASTLPTAISPKERATMAILVREKMERNALNRW